jgi:Ca2+-binding EF-hand superfamily protein
MFKLLPSLAVVFAVGSVLSPLARANEPGIPRSEHLFGRLDTNSDGRLAIEEIRPSAERRFMRLDTDGDGRVTTAEIDAWLAKIEERRRQRILDHMDLDKDGAVTKAELDAYLEKLFATVDSDHDGGVTLAEAQAYHAAKARRTFLKDASGKREQP